MRLSESWQSWAGAPKLAMTFGDTAVLLVAPNCMLIERAYAFHSGGFGVVCSPVANISLQGVLHVQHIIRRHEARKLGKVDLAIAIIISERNQAIKNAFWDTEVEHGVQHELELLGVALPGCVRVDEAECSTHLLESARNERLEVEPVPEDFFVEFGVLLLEGHMAGASCTRLAFRWHVRWRHVVLGKQLSPSWGQLTERSSTVQVRVVERISKSLPRHRSGQPRMRMGDPKRRLRDAARLDWHLGKLAR
mmetsp:Transcript_9929/g.25634  ORF Transcript_9929/g.25634 Transcript_9929/m.25634 type:complete len:250 (-) Transcript_9929:357-1106(-)